MNLSEIKEILSSVEHIEFILPDHTSVPESFHVTEIGQINKRFIDCGGTVRSENLISFQLWNINDDHRLKPQKLLNIIALSEQKLQLENLEIEVEYQTDTIGKYALDFDRNKFLLKPKYTACLANEVCGIPGKLQPPKDTAVSCCSPESKCC